MVFAGFCACENLPSIKKKQPQTTTTINFSDFFKKFDVTEV